MLKYKFRVPVSSGGTYTHINVPIVMENQMVDQAEIIERKFVDIEVEKSINPIIDYEKAKFRLYDGLTRKDEVTYNLTLLNNATDYDSIGFTDSDLAFRSNAFRNTFLRLSFYDSDRLSSQRLISFMTMFSTIYEGDMINDKIVAASQKPILFKAVSEGQRTRDPSEGFNIFHFKDEVILNEPPKILYMKAEFNNAKTGKSVNLMTSSNVVGIDSLVNQLHTKYLLKRDLTRGYYYEIEGSSGNVNLYEIDSL